MFLCCGSFKTNKKRNTGSLITLANNSIVNSGGLLIPHINLISLSSVHVNVTNNSMRLAKKKSDHVNALEMV